MLTPDGVGFYSYMTATVFGDTSISVDEVISPRLNRITFYIFLIIKLYIQYSL